MIRLVVVAVAAVADDDEDAKYIHRFHNARQTSARVYMPGVIVFTLSLEERRYYLLGINESLSLSPLFAGGRKKESTETGFKCRRRARAVSFEFRIRVYPLRASPGNTLHEVGRPLSLYTFLILSSFGCCCCFFFTFVLLSPSLPLSPSPVFFPLFPLFLARSLAAPHVS